MWGGEGVGRGDVPQDDRFNFKSNRADRCQNTRFVGVARIYFHPLEVHK